MIALAAATAIFFTTSLLVMDTSSPILGKGFGPSQFVSRVGRTAALAGVGGGKWKEGPAAVNASVEEEEEMEEAQGKKGDVVKTCT